MLAVSTIVSVDFLLQELVQRARCPETEFNGGPIRVFAVQRLVDDGSISKVKRCNA